MWIFSKTGFYSVVRHDTDLRKFLVRARTREDLVDLIQTFDSFREYDDSIIEDHPTADYRWRMEVDELALIDAVVDQLDGIDYTTNVKGNLDKGDPIRHKAMMEVWDSMYALQEGGETDGSPNSL